jgi:hypothetical protein
MDSNEQFFSLHAINAYYIGVKFCVSVEKKSIAHAMSKTVILPKCTTVVIFFLCVYLSSVHIIASLHDRTARAAREVPYAHSHSGGPGVCWEGCGH